MRKYDLLNWDDFEKDLFNQPGFKEANANTSLEYEIARALIKARLENGLTQTDVAKLMNTKQSVISRVENARTMPSLTFLKKLAGVLNASLRVEFKV